MRYRFYFTKARLQVNSMVYLPTKWKVKVALLQSCARARAAGMHRKKKLKNRYIHALSCRIEYLIFIIYNTYLPCKPRKKGKKRAAKVGVGRPEPRGLRGTRSVLTEKLQYAI